MTPPLAPPRRKLALCLAQPGLVGDFTGAFSDHLEENTGERERLVASTRLTFSISVSCRRQIEEHQAGSLCPEGALDSVEAQIDS
ncbi:hypothetical protein INR49_024538, partial [Caranx melampygus]